MIEKTLSEYSDDEEAAKRILSAMDDGEIEILRAHFVTQEAEKLNDAQERVMEFMTRLFSFFCFPFNASKFWAVVYALDLPFHEGINIASKSRQIGATRANISGYCTDLCAMLNMPPSRWMRSEETADRSKEARESALMPHPDSDEFFSETEPE